MNKVVYLTRNSLLEPLGQSQVMAYLRGLSIEYDITLITFEKPNSWFNKQAMNLARKDCELHGIRWLPNKFRSQPKIIAPIFSIFQMIWLVIKEHNSQKINLIHARSYIPALVALLMNRVIKVPFIFDMRALWPEELIVSGKIHRDSLVHQTIKRIERACLAKSKAVISLTKVAVDHLKSIYPDELKNKKILIIPTCVDLSRFTPLSQKSKKTIIHGCIGTILSGWFRIEWLSSWINLVTQFEQNTQFEIITQDDLKEVKEKIDPFNELNDRLKIISHTVDEMPFVVPKFFVSLMFFTDGLSKLGSSPTRMAESLACGIPIVINKGIGDTENIIKKYNVGVIVEGNGKELIEKAIRDLMILLKDPDLNSRCRLTAKNLFSLDSGTQTYRETYRSILK